MIAACLVGGGGIDGMAEAGAVATAPAGGPAFLGGPDFLAYSCARTFWVSLWLGSTSRMSLQTAMARGRKPSLAYVSAATLWR